jgi:hypothetical protein
LLLLLLLLIDAATPVTWCSLVLLIRTWWKSYSFS